MKNKTEDVSGTSLLFHLEFDRYLLLTALFTFFLLVATLHIVLHKTRLKPLVDIFPESCFLLLLGLCSGAFVATTLSESTNLDAYITSDLFFKVSFRNTKASGDL